MKLQLSRIEREYVLRELAAERPALEILNTGSISRIDSGHWQLDVAQSHIHLDAHQTFSSASCTLFFTVKGRCFTAAINLEKSTSAYNFALPEAIFKHDQKSGHLAGLQCRLLPEQGAAVTAVPLEEFPPDALSLLSTDLDRVFDLILQKLITRSFPSTSSGREPTGFSPVQIRCARYLAAIRSSIIPEPSLKVPVHFLHVDHHWLILGSFGELTQLSKSECQLDLQFKNRFIHCPVRFVALISDGTTVISAYDISAACEEDKRFLYERMYNSPYK